MTNIFFDTEFSHAWELLTPEPSILVSIGCISEDGKKFYAENANLKRDKCSQFVIENVLPLLDGGNKRVPYGRLAHHLQSYTESFDDEVVFWSDCPSVDWCHVSDMFGFFGWPDNLNRTPKALFFDAPNKQAAFELGVQNAFSTLKLRQHHAMDDAIANRAGYLAATR